MLIIYAGTSGATDDIPVEACRRFETELYAFVESAYPNLLPSIKEKRELTAGIKEELVKAFKDFKGRFQA